jgi:ABC-type branched-subunit amino acid transport system substrate-binding protein
LRVKTIALFSVLLIGFVTGGCKTQGGLLSAPLALGSLWLVPSNESELSWDLAAPLAAEGHQGVILSAEQIPNYVFIEKAASEGEQNDDLQEAVRHLIEQDEVIAILGATSNDATMRTAALVNFFNVPMMIPTAEGDNLLPSTNQWAFRLSAPGSAYGRWAFGALITKPFGLVVTPTPSESASADSPASGLKIAILYEANTFGESAAVATAQAAMKQMMQITVYGKFDAEKPDTEKLQGLAAEARSTGAQLVYLISSDPDIAGQLVQAFRREFGPASLPVLLGQSGGFASQAFLTSTNADSVYVIRQQIQPKSCPDPITTPNKAQNYAAVYLLNAAVNQVKDQMPVVRFQFPPQKQEVLTVAALREKIRDMLKLTNIDVPCIGRVAFDNTGQNKQVSFEIVKVNQGKLTLVSIEEFNGLLNR